jgi:hypothetical protein
VYAVTPLPFWSWIVEELERRRQEEQKRLQDLDNRALRWTRAVQLRAYFAEVEIRRRHANLLASVVDCLQKAQNSQALSNSCRRLFAGTKDSHPQGEFCGLAESF